MDRAATLLYTVIAINLPVLVAAGFRADASLPPNSARLPHANGMECPAWLPFPRKRCRFDIEATPLSSAAPAEIPKSHPADS